MTASGTGDRQAGSGIVVRAVAQFALVALAALAIVAVTIGIATRRVGEREAIANARAVTALKAQNIVEPAVTAGVRRGDRGAIERLDAVVREDVLDESLVRVKVWTKAGEIVYSDAVPLIGATFALGTDETEALATGQIVAEASDLDEPENRFERQYGKLLEVYLPIDDAAGDPLLFEAYYRYDDVERSGSDLWWSFAPIALGGLVVLQLIQIPLAWSLARRLQDRIREREALTWRALEASEVERRQIASDLHDGVVQDLSGVAYGLSAAAREPATTTPETLESSAASVRGAVRALRSLVVDLAPAELEEAGLAAALEELARRMSSDALVITAETSGETAPFGPGIARLLYRAAQEGLRNVVLHARASRAVVRLATSPGEATVEVRDDGVGFDIGDLAARAEAGHVGLRALRGLVGDAGGRLDVESRPGAGTTLRVTVPT